MTKSSVLSPGVRKNDPGIVSACLSLSIHFSPAFSKMRKLDSSSRLARLRDELRKRNLDAYFLPMEDSHCSEYLTATDKRIAFISGFTGSASTAVITTD
ncbi:unnamed protein product [Dibothriocephalus latus]|uniref:Uncharacterized protein n=1 Tax=Dibothriocephalus latus TaxID=60516 RepID=A0A3P7MET9_DIBLA|nr:unnamed protein product [Dibothriocephalus latus]